MTTAERIHTIVDALTPEQQQYLLEVAERIAHPQSLTRDELLALPLEARARLIESSLTNAAFDNYEIFEASDPIYDYDGASH